MADHLNDNDLEHSYDEVPYPSHAYPQSDPSHLFILAKLFGLKPSVVEYASVLELGCAGGGNLIPLAFHFPKAHFFGIDISGKEIAEGRNKIRDLNLKNIKLEQRSILDFNTNDKFDYILCHGVYSWVDDKVREKIFQIIHNNLHKDGIAYISYNTYPGWNSVKNVRDLMLWYTKNTKSPHLKATQARYILQYYSEGLKDSSTQYAQVLRNETESISNHTDAYLLHDHLSVYNEPVYFYQFMQQATKYNLSYICDSTLWNEYINILPTPFINDLKNVEDVIDLGQRIDFIRNQRFRWSLLCHDSQKINREISVNELEQYDIQLKANIDPPDVTENDIGKLPNIMMATSFSHMKITHPVAQMAVLILNNNKHKPIPYSDLCAILSQKTPFSSNEEITNILRDRLYLISGVFAGLFKMSLNTRSYNVKVTEKPIACPLVRYLAMHDNNVTNRRHENISLDAISKCILPFLNGDNHISSLKEIIRSRLSLETLNLLDEEKHPILDKIIIDKHLTHLCTTTLKKLASQAILIG